MLLFFSICSEDSSGVFLTKTLFASNLSTACTNEEIREMFEKYGGLEELYHKQQGRYAIAVRLH